MAYEHLAKVYERLSDDCGYPEWSEHLLGLLKEYSKGKLGLELGCGTGYFCRALSRAGYVMTGADRSFEMLTEAEKRCREEGMTLPFFLADAANLHTIDRYDFILSPNDCFNYIEGKKLKNAFQKVRACLKKGGIFIFDVSSPCKLRRLVADTVCCDDREDVTYLCLYRGREKAVEMDVTLFLRRSDGAFDRFDERHVQYIHETEELLSALEASGFEVLKTQGIGERKEDRIEFVCRN